MGAVEGAVFASAANTAGGGRESSSSETAEPIRLKLIRLFSSWFIGRLDDWTGSENTQTGCGGLSISGERLLDAVASRGQRIADWTGTIRGDRVDAEPDHIERDRWVVDGPDDGAQLLARQPGNQRRRDGEAGIDAGQSVLLDQRD